MRSVAWLVRRRLARRWVVWVAVGLLLGGGFGLSLAAFNTARRTTSAYDRVLTQAQAPDASIAHNLSGDEAEEALGDLTGVTGRRHLLGFTGFVDGVDPALTRAMLAADGPRFPIERPQLDAGRLPARDRVDEVFVNRFLADRAGMEVGDRLGLHLLVPPTFTDATSAPVTVVGIGTLARDAVIDETAGNGLMVFGEAFADRYRDLRGYAGTYVDLAPGVDPLRDLAPAVGALGLELQEARSQEAQAVDDALRPIVAILIAIGVLAFVATAVAAAQIFQRDQDRTRADDEHLPRLGMAREQVVLVLLAPAALVALLAAPAALVVTAGLSPLAPAGPLHELDPGQGMVVEPLVAVAGAAAIMGSVLGVAAVLASRRRVPGGRSDVQPGTQGWAPQQPIPRAGLALSFGGRDRRRRARRAAGFAAVAVMLAALVVTLVASATALSGTPTRYGFDWDLLASTPYGDQTRDGLDTVFGDDPAVDAATGFTSWSLLLDGRAVPALGATPVKGGLAGPSILRGRALRADDEVVVGRDTLDRLGIEIGDRVAIEASRLDGTPADAPSSFRIVGIATFPPVSQVGTDQPRLGSGALVTRRALDRLIGSDQNDPEWTAVRLADGESADDVIARWPDGVPDRAGFPSTWYRDAKPAELRQLDEVRSLMFGAVVISALTAVGVVVHALWAQTRANRRDLAVLGAIGFTRRQRGGAAAWQAVPLGAAVVVLGIPLGLALGRLVFASFAESLAVDDRASMPAGVLAALLAGALVAVATGALVANAVARRTRTVGYLRAE